MSKEFIQRLIACSLLFFFIIKVGAQNNSASSSSSPQRPKLVVGIVVDQMRWDYLYRYSDKYLPNGGFKRLLSQGFSCENTMIPYVPTITACGHTCIYTGSVPAISGITGNDWFDYDKDSILYCTEDNTVTTVGSKSAEGQMSPRNLMVTTIGDELKLATNFRSKVVGIALKDRSAILPAGHAADAAYWYDDETGDWITSSYYKESLPTWMKYLNTKKLVDTYYALDWNPLYPLNTYTESDLTGTGLPYNLKQFTGKNYKTISSTPFGNSLTFDVAKAAIGSESLGEDSVTDLLTVSLSSPDYIGHAFGPNSPEAEDCYLRLDKDIGEFLDFLDSKIGKGKYFIFLTADHGVANKPSFLQAHTIPAGNFDNDKVTTELGNLLNAKFKAGNLVYGIINSMVYLNRNEIEKRNINKDSVYATVIGYLMQNPAVERAFAVDEIGNTTLISKIKEAVTNGYYPSRSGDIQIVFQPQWIDGFLTRGTTHGEWYPYDSHIPLMWYGWGILQGKTNREVYMTDISATIAAMLHIQMPSGCVGHVIPEVIK